MRAIYLVSILALTSVLASCGGGGDVAGDTTGFNVFPSETTYTPVLGTKKNDAGETVAALCGEQSGGGTGQYVINGGQPPYRLIVSQTDLVSVSATTLSGKDPSFTASYNGSACESTTTVTILDYHSNTTVLKINVKPEDPEL